MKEDEACPEFELCSSTRSICRHHRTPWILYLKITRFNHIPQTYYDYHLTEEIGGFRDTDYCETRSILAANFHLNNFILLNSKSHTLKCSEIGTCVNYLFKYRTE